MDDFAASLAPGTLLNQRFRIESVLGEGGFGITYSARDDVLGHVVAVKELLPENAVRTADGSVITRTGDLRPSIIRFLDEARTIAKLRHPGIVAVHDFFEANRTAYMVMEYLRGATLAQHIDSHGPWPEASALSLLRQLGAALEPLHASGFLHRDVKPNNIVLTDDRGPVLIDFGAARQSSVDHTASITRIVTHGYAAPEQYGSTGRIGPFTDVYGLGATLYTTLAGERPASSLDRLQDPSLYRPIGTLRPDLSRPFGEGIDVALRLNPRERPQTSAQLISFCARPAATHAAAPTIRLADLKPSASSSLPELTGTNRRSLVVGIMALSIVAALALGFALSKASTRSASGPDTVGAPVVVASSDSAATVTIMASPPTPARLTESPEQFVRRYYADIDRRALETAYESVGPALRARGNSWAHDGYVNFWTPFSSAAVTSADVVSQWDGGAILDVSQEFVKGSTRYNELARFTLANDGGRYLIVDYDVISSRKVSL